MKLVTWNCQGAFRKKAAAILLHKPDILVVQECEHPDKLIFGSETPKPNDVLWFGDNKHKGLGVFSYGDHRFQIIDKHNQDLKIVLPVLVSGGKVDFTLFAIWANNRDDPDGQYVEQIWKAIHHYDEYLSGLSILTGDFNSNTIWDKPRRIGNHTAVVKKLFEKNIHSIYHKHFNQEQGKEKHPTFYLYRNKTKPYHMDYCFSSGVLLEKVKSIKVGTFKKWIALSDHTPLMVEFEM